MEVPSPVAFIEEAIAARPDFSMERFATALLRNAGGEEGMAARWEQEYQAAEPGSNTRKALLEMMYKVLEKTAMDPAEGVEPEDLRAEARALLKE